MTLRLEYWSIAPKTFAALTSANRSLGLGAGPQRPAFSPSEKPNDVEE